MEEQPAIGCAPTGFLIRNEIGVGRLVALFRLPARIGAPNDERSKVGLIAGIDLDAAEDEKSPLVEGFPELTRRLVTQRLLRIDPDDLGTELRSDLSNQ
jgi:hypothetical protein